MATSADIQPRRIPEAMTLTHYRRTHSHRQRVWRRLLRPHLCVLAAALAALGLASFEASAQSRSAGTASVQGCAERSGQMPADALAVRKRVPRRFALYRDPVSGKPLLNVRVLKCRRFALNGNASPLMLAVVSALIESPDGTGCTSRIPGIPLQAHVGRVPPFNWCNYYVIFNVSSNRDWVSWTRDGTPEFPAHYVSDFLWQDGPSVLGTPMRTFHFEAAAPTPSQFAIDAFPTRELLGNIPVSAAFWVESRRGLVKINPRVDASYGDMQGSLRTEPGSEIAELLGSDTASFAPGYSIFGSFRFDGVMRKEIVPAAGTVSR